MSMELTAFGSRNPVLSWEVCCVTGPHISASLTPSSLLSGSFTSKIAQIVNALPKSEVNKPSLQTSFLVLPVSARYVLESMERFLDTAMSGLNPNSVTPEALEMGLQLRHYI